MNERYVSFSFDSEESLSLGRWPILNFASFAKFRVGMLELIQNQRPPVREEWRSSRNRRHENTKELQGSVQQ